VKNFTFDAWDAGRLTINRDFAELFHRHALTTCERIWKFTDTAEAAKALRVERVTLRFTLRQADGSERTFYIKRHRPSSWREYVKPWLNGQRPLLGAKHEWLALLAFHRVGLPTMIPVALGKIGERSFLITEGLVGCEKLSSLAANGLADETQRRTLIGRVAKVARTMHAAGLHHQDFYLGHLMWEQAGEPRRMYVIDLGRVQPHRPWFARRWIVKDLAQLNYSAVNVRRTEKLRFLLGYVQRPLAKGDRQLIRGILRKTSRIARHSG
jgi:hypothetical protein